MMTTMKMQSGIDYIQLKWTIPSLLPKHYKLAIMCKLKCNHKQYLRRTLKILSTENSTLVEYLAPWSECDIRFTAVYNPSSLDPGIHRIIPTASTCKSYYFQLDIPQSVLHSSSFSA